MFFHCIFSPRGNHSMHLIPRAWRDSATPCTTVHTFRPFPDPSHSADNMHTRKLARAMLQEQHPLGTSGFLQAHHPPSPLPNERTNGFRRQESQPCFLCFYKHRGRMRRRSRRISHLAFCPTRIVFHEAENPKNVGPMENESLHGPLTKNTIVYGKCREEKIRATFQT